MGFVPIYTDVLTPKLFLKQPARSACMNRRLLVSLYACISIHLFVYLSAWGPIHLCVLKMYTLPIQEAKKKDEMLLKFPEKLQDVQSAARYTIT